MSQTILTEQNKETESHTEFVFNHNGKPCPCCGSTLWHRGPGLAPWDSFVDRSNPKIIECGNCGTAHLPPVRLGVYTKRHAVTGHEAERSTHIEKAKVNVERVVGFAKKYVTKQRGSALVIGCDVGHEVQAFLNTSLNLAVIDGIEPIKESVEYARKRFANNGEVTIYHGLLEEMAADKTYDIISATMVLEHIVDPLSAVMNASKHHNTGGLLAIQVPRYDNVYPRFLRTHLWHGVHLDHLWYFTKRGIQLLVKQCGYTPVDVINSPRIATPHYAFFRISRATLRHVYPYLNKEKQEGVKRWIKKQQDKQKKSNLNFKIGFLQDAMTVIARKEGS